MTQRFLALLSTLILLCAAAPLVAQEPGVAPAPFADLADADLSAEIASRLGSLTDAPADPAIILFERKVVAVYQDKVPEETWDGAVLARDGLDGPLTHRLPLAWNTEPERVEAWIRRADGSVLRIGDADLVRETDEVTGRVTVVLEDADARPGDVLGWSVVGPAGGSSMTRIRAVGDLYKAEFSFRLIGLEALTHRIAIVNGTPGASVHAVRESNGQPTDQVAVVPSVPARGEIPFGAPDRLREPWISVQFHGTFPPEMGRWLFFSSWGGVAQFLDTIQNESLKEVPVTESVARQALDGDESDRKKLLKLRRLVDKQLTTIPQEKGSPGGKTDDILERKAATEREKLFVVFVMSRTAGLDTDLVMARDRRLGPLDERNPGPNQFTDLLLRLNGEDPIYMCSEPGYPLGELPHHLRGAVVVSAKPGASEEFQMAVMTAAMGGQSKPDPASDALLIRNVLPGDPDGVRSEFSETLARQDDGSWKLSLNAVGETDQYLEYRQSRDAAAVLTEHMAASFPDLAATPGEIKAGKPKSSPHRMHVVLRGPVSLDAATPEPAGDAWTLPASLVFGAPTLEGWTPGAAFRIDGDRSVTRVWSSPLPKGWKKIASIEPLELKSAGLDYEATVTVEDGVLKVTRTAVFHTCDLAPERTAALTRAAERITAFETSPLVVRKD